MKLAHATALLVIVGSAGLATAARPASTPGFGESRAYAAKAHTYEFTIYLTKGGTVKDTVEADNVTEAGHLVEARYPNDRVGGCRLVR